MYLSAPHYLLMTQYFSFQFIYTKQDFHLLSVLYRSEMFCEVLTPVSKLQTHVHLQGTNKTLG